MSTLAPAVDAPDVSVFLLGAEGKARAEQDFSSTTNREPYHHNGEWKFRVQAQAMPVA